MWWRSSGVGMVVTLRATPDDTWVLRWPLQLERRRRGQPLEQVVLIPLLSRNSSSAAIKVGVSNIFGSPPPWTMLVQTKRCGSALVDGA